MDPDLLRGGFRIGFLILALSLISLPFQPAGSAEQVVTVMAAAIAGAFVLGIALLARRAEPRPPQDKPDRKGYNRGSTGGKQ